MANSTPKDEAVRILAGAKKLDGLSAWDSTALGTKTTAEPCDRQ